MKKHLWPLLSLVSLSCHQPQPIPTPDAATKVAGIYDLTYMIAYQKAYTDQPGSLTLVRTDAQRVKPTFQIGIPDTLIERGSWQLTEVNKDSIFYRGSSYGGGIKNGQIDMFGYGDGMFFFRFVKRQ
jgi:hypothetical protein